VTAGIKHYRKTQGWTGLPRDLARFVAFNLFETSLAQKIALSPDGAQPGETPRWDVGIARQRGHLLFADAMEDGDASRPLLVADQSAEWKQVRAELDALAADPEALPEEDVMALCDRIALLSSGSGAGTRVPCSEQLSVAGLQKLIPENRILRSHLSMIRREHPKLQLLIYGHTHEMRKPWPVEVDAETLTVVNTGAFQRLLDEDALQREATARNKTATEVFATMPLEDIPACYPAVLVKYAGPLPKPELANWFVDPATGKGSMIDACDPRCGYRSRKSCESG
jgi:hypothetical protein